MHGQVLMQWWDRHNHVDIFRSMSQYYSWVANILLLQNHHFKFLRFLFYFIWQANVNIINSANLKDCTKAYNRWCQLETKEINKKLSSIWNLRNQIDQSIIDIEPPSKDILAQSKRLHKNDDLRAWSDVSTFSNDLSTF